MSLIETVVAAVLASGIWILIIAFLGKSLLSSLLAKDLEKLKGDIAAQNIEKQIVLSRITEKRADAILNIYNSLISYVHTSKRFVYSAEHVDEAEREDLLNALSDSSNSFRETYENNHLYLTSATCESIQNVFKEVQIPAHKFIFAVGAYLHSGEMTDEEYGKEWEKAFFSFADKIPPLLKELETQFRGLLGVECEN